MGWTKDEPNNSATQSRWSKIRPGQTQSKSKRKRSHGTENLFKRIETWLLRKLIARNIPNRRCNRFGGYDSKGRILLCQKISHHLEGRHHYAAERIYVVAENYQHFQFWCEDRGISTKEATYVFDPKTLHGVESGEFIIYETAPLRKDYYEILEQVRIIKAIRGY